MKNYMLALLGLGLMGCASTEEVYKKTSLLRYEVQPLQDEILRKAKPIIQAQLKDPDSLKNLTVATSYKCYASKMKMADNVSPKYDYGYWCYNFSYQATNTYGGYVPGKSTAVYYQGQLHSVNELKETIRKFNDIGVWHSPSTL